jgi:hypothetical protein
VAPLDRALALAQVDDPAVGVAQEPTAPASARLSEPGSVGTSASRASALAAHLSPMRSMASGEGPTQTSPAALTSAAKSAFSERKP